MKFVLVYLYAIIALSSAQVAFELPAGFETLLARVDQTFDCADKPYGFYADPQNECKVFHVCSPVYNNEGQVSITYFY